MKKRLNPLFYTALVCTSSMSIHVAAAQPTDTLPASTPTVANPTQIVASPTPVKSTENQRVLPIIDQVPGLIDATPTVFPPESNQASVPKEEDSKDRTWTDRQQHKLHDWIDLTAARMDSWFGPTDYDQPADASLRIFIDSTYNRYDKAEYQPRIKGKIVLPTLKRKFSLVFGDDSLDNELDSSANIENENPLNRVDKSYDPQRAREDNSSIALRWSALSKSLPFDFDADLGIRSRDDVYARLKLKRDWPFANDFNLHAEQVYRYGLKSENYLRTNVELSHARPNNALISNQFSLTYADKQDDDLLWDNYIFRQHQFFQHHRFNYGLMTAGFYDQQDLRLNSWGPYTSWRQPLWREWFFVQGDLNYLNQHREHRSHTLGAMIRLEALF